MQPAGVVREPDRNLALELVRATEAAALAASRWVGRGQKEAADQAAVDAMRGQLSSVSIAGTVVIGEGEKDPAPNRPAANAPMACASKPGSDVPLVDSELEVYRPLQPGLDKAMRSWGDSRLCSKDDDLFKEER
jgi:hypothetical protein